MDEIKITGGNVPISLELCWIDCKERMPENDDFVIGYDGEHVGECRFDNYEFWFWAYGGIAEITHWMPLPKPPEVKND